MVRRLWVMGCILMLFLGAACLPALAAPLSPTSYDMLNGRTGSFNYRDFIYNPDPNGNKDISSAPLIGGLGKLTDGAIVTGHWYDYGQPTPYVGWTDFDPTITFHFAGTVNVNQVGIHVDNTPGYGDVRYPATVDIKVGAVTDHFTITADPNYDTKWFYFTTSGLSGDTLELTLGRDSGRWIMLDEVSFNGTPVPLPPGLLLMGTGLLGLLGWRRLRP
jgi:hypothetical protein